MIGKLLGTQVQTIARYALDLTRTAAPYFGLGRVRANAIIDEVAAALDGWQQIARRLRMSASDLAAYATAIEDAA